MCSRHLPAGGSDFWDTEHRQHLKSKGTEQPCLWNSGRSCSSTKSSSAGAAGGFNPSSHIFEHEVGFPFVKTLFAVTEPQIKSENTNPGGSIKFLLGQGYSQHLLPLTQQSSLWRITWAGQKIIQPEDEVPAACTDFGKFLTEQGFAGQVRGFQGSYSAGAKNWFFVVSSDSKHPEQEVGTGVRMPRAGSSVSAGSEGFTLLFQGKIP